MRNHVGIYSLGCTFARYERNVVSGKRAANFTANFTHTALRPIAPHRISELFTCNKSNTTIAVVLSFVA